MIVTESNLNATDKAADTTDAKVRIEEA